MVFAAQHTQAPAQRQNRHDHEGHDQQHKPRELGACEEHQNHSAQEYQHIAQRHRNRRANHRLDQGGIRCDAAQDFACHHRLIKARRQPDHAIKHSFADIGHNALSQPSDKRIAQPRAQSEKSSDADRGDKIKIQYLDIFGAEVVNHTAHSQRQSERERRRQHQRQNSRNN